MEEPRRVCGSREFGVPDFFGLAKFWNACQRHDVCYSTCGVARVDCDTVFGLDLATECVRAYWWLPPLLESCFGVAAVYAGVVASMGGQAYREAQEVACRPVSEGESILKLLKLHCHQTESISGRADSLVLYLNDENVWADHMRNGEDRYPQITRPLGAGALRLYDKDSFLFDSDDWLGTHVVRPSEMNRGNRLAHFREDEADYELTYCVERTSTSGPLLSVIDSGAGGEAAREQVQAALRPQLEWMRRASEERRGSAGLVANVRTKEIHLSTCRWATKISRPNKRTLSDNEAAEAIAVSLDACAFCIGRPSHGPLEQRR